MFNYTKFMFIYILKRLINLKFILSSFKTVIKTKIICFLKKIYK